MSKEKDKVASIETELKTVASEQLEQDIKKDLEKDTEEISIASLLED